MISKEFSISMLVLGGFLTALNLLIIRNAFHMIGTTPGADMAIIYVLANTVVTAGAFYRAWKDLGLNWRKVSGLVKRNGR